MNESSDVCICVRVKKTVQKESHRGLRTPFNNTPLHTHKPISQPTFIHTNKIIQNAQSVYSAQQSNG